MRYANNANEFLFGQVRGLDVDQSRNREILMDELKRDYMAADLRLSLFCSAVQSFKYESLLKPVPESFKRQDGEVDVERLQLLIRRLPRLPLCSENFEDEVSNLMVSVLTAGSHRLTQMTMESLLEKTDGQLQFTAACPHWVFQVDRSLSHNRNWDQIRADNQTFLAFHGSRFENFYSILNLGLHQHLNKTSLFGKGIYLSTEQSLSLQYSTCGEGWSKSTLGPRLSILSVCEVIDHPIVKRKDHRNRQSSVPEKYIVVPNNELVRVKYLLVYRAPSVSKQSTWGRYKFVVLIGIYIAILFFIRFVNNQRVY